MMRKFPSKLGGLTLLLVMLHIPCPFTDKVTTHQLRDPDGSSKINLGDSLLGQGHNNAVNSKGKVITWKSLRAFEEILLKWGLFDCISSHEGLEKKKILRYPEAKKNVPF